MQPHLARLQPYVCPGGSDLSSCLLRAIVNMMNTTPDVTLLPEVGLPLTLTLNPNPNPDPNPNPGPLP